jgi:hypothetical protein
MNKAQAYIKLRPFACEYSTDPEAVEAARFWLRDYITSRDIAAAKTSITRPVSDDPLKVRQREYTRRWRERQKEAI